MNQPPQTGKRIVSKGEYAKAQGRRLGLLVLAVCVFGLGMIAAQIQESSTFVHIVGLIIFTFCWQIGKVFFKKARQIIPGVPLTRANTADLLAPDSLVRASEQPRPEHESILLRAAAESAQTPPEQLVRAVER